MKKIFPYVELSNDKPYWISRADFIQYFDQADFAIRECAEVEDAYSPACFGKDENNREVFILPVVAYINGTTQFINGRHRTAVLLKHMDLLPFALVTPFAISSEILKKITQNPINLGQPIEIPDLPIIKI
jgi:hypothetical protein